MPTGAACSGRRRRTDQPSGEQPGAAGERLTVGAVVDGRGGRIEQQRCWWHRLLSDRHKGVS